MKFVPPRKNSLKRINGIHTICCQL